MRKLWIGVFLLGLAALASLFANGQPNGLNAAAQASAHPFRVLAIQVASTPTPIGARCNDHTFHEYTGPATCADHGGVHYWIYPGNT